MILVSEVACGEFYRTNLPRGFLNARNISFKRFLAETDAAEVEITHEAAWAAALEATTNHARSELRCAICLDDH